MVPFASYASHGQSKPRLIFSRINGPNVAKTRSRMTTAITFSRQNVAASNGSNTQYWENLVVVDS